MMSRGLGPQTNPLRRTRVATGRSKMSKAISVFAALLVAMILVVPTVSQAAVSPPPPPVVAAS
jgi:hypothetical protein